eukprot:5837885-Pyramimonas_sp.AAC.1
MERPGVVVADAAQAFEMVSQDSVRGSIESLFADAGARGFPDTVHVFREARLNGDFGGSIGVVHKDRDAFTFRTLRRCCNVVLRMACYRFGPLVVTQVSGIPIGGPMSRILLSVVCCHREFVFDQR